MSNLDLSSARERLAASGLFDAMQVDSATALSMQEAKCKENNVMILILHSLALGSHRKVQPEKVPQIKPQIDTTMIDTVPSASASPFSSMSPDALAKHLISILGESLAQLTLYKNLVQKLGVAGVQDVLHETECAISPGGSEAAPTVRMDNEMRLRTASGTFIKLAKARMKRSEVEEKIKAETAKAAGIKLYDYQHEAIDKIMSLNAASPGGERRNLVVCSPTGSGKTMIFIEVSRRLLQSTPSAKILVVVPTVALVEQQCAAYRAAGFGGEEANEANAISLSPKESMFKRHHRVDWFCGDKPLTAPHWLDELKRLSVLVIESASFKNLLEDPDKRCCLSHLDLLVLDEAHHAKEAHPYAIILQHYNLLKKKLSPSPSPSPSPFSPPSSLDLPSAQSTMRVDVALPLPPVPPPWKIRYQKDKPHSMLVDKEKEKEIEEGEIVTGNRLLPHLLGFSATPAGGSTDEMVRSKMNALLTLLGADLHVISDMQVFNVAPPPSEEKEEVEARSVDVAFVSTLEDLFLQAAITLGLELLTMASSCTSSDDDDGRSAAASLAKTKKAIEGSLRDLRKIVSLSQQLSVQQANEINKWANELGELAALWSKEGMSIGLSILTALRLSRDMTVEMGMECGLHFLVRRITHIATKAARMSADVDGAGGGGEGGGEAMEIETSGSDEETADDGMFVLGSLDSLSKRVRREMTLESLVVGRNKCPGGGGGRQGAGNPWAALALPPVDFKGQAILDLCRAILHQAIPPLNPPQANNPSNDPEAKSASPPYDELPALALFVPGRLSSLLDHSSAISPKIKALYFYLNRYRAKEAFHGIVFTRTRQGAEMLHKVLSIASLPFIDELLLFMGHGNSSGGGGGGGGDEAAARGQSSKGQTSILERFRSPGRKLLVATNAAEEGIDCPGCEFVVRFTSPASGTQRIQSKGRGRKLGSVFFTIVLKATGGDGASLMKMDEMLDNKSRLEEEAMRRVYNSGSYA